MIFTDAIALLLGVLVFRRFRWSFAKEIRHMFAVKVDNVSKRVRRQLAQPASSPKTSIMDFILQSRRPVEIAFAHVGIAADAHLIVDPTPLRSAGVDMLVGDASKACTGLGWGPAVSFKRVVT
jgi:GDP-D-mannose dehydratase